MPRTKVLTPEEAKERQKQSYKKWYATHREEHLEKCKAYNKNLYEMGKKYKEMLKNKEDIDISVEKLKG